MKKAKKDGLVPSRFQVDPPPIPHFLQGALLTFFFPQIKTPAKNRFGWQGFLLFCEILGLARSLYQGRNSRPISLQMASVKKKSPYTIGICTPLS